MLPEYNIFLLWNNARPREQELKDEITHHFDIIRTYEITWSDKFFLKNLSRFYGKKLPSAKHKVKLCGRGGFILLLVKDNAPVLMENGKNQNMSAVKYKLRQILGNNYLHASDNQPEAEENIYFLLGKTLEQILQEPQTSKLRKLKQDLIGEPTWLDEDKFKRAIHQLPNAQYDKQNKVLICQNVGLAKRLLNARRVWFTLKTDCYKISIRGYDEVIQIKQA